MQHPELGRTIGPDYVGAGRKELPELDVARAKLVESGGKPAPGRLGARHEEAIARLRGKRQRVDLLRGQHTIAREYPAGAEESRNVPQPIPDQIRQPQWIATMPPDRLR